MTIAGMMAHDEINKAAPDRSESFLRKYLKDLAPSNKPGRRHKKN